MHYFTPTFCLSGAVLSGKKERARERRRPSHCCTGAGRGQPGAPSCVIQFARARARTQGGAIQRLTQLILISQSHPIPFHFIPGRGRYLSSLRGARPSTGPSRPEPYCISRLPRDARRAQSAALGLPWRSDGNLTRSPRSPLCGRGAGQGRDHSLASGSALGSATALPTTTSPRSPPSRSGGAHPSGT